MNEPIVEPFGLGHFLRFVRIEIESDVKIAVTGMPDNPCRQERSSNVFLGLGDTLSQPGNRHANVGSPALRTWPRRLARKVSIVSRLPQLAAVLRFRCPGEMATAMISGDLLDHFCLLGDTVLCAVELDPEHRRNRQVELRIPND